MSNDVLKIELNHIDPQICEDLFRFFCEQSRKGIKKWEKGEVFYFWDGRGFMFEREVCSRLRKSRNNVPSKELRYLVVPDFTKPIKKGGYSLLYGIDTFAFNQYGEYRYKTAGKDGNKSILKVNHFFEPCLPNSPSRSSDATEPEEKDSSPIEPKPKGFRPAVAALFSQIKRSRKESIENEVFYSKQLSHLHLKDSTIITAAITKGLKECFSFTAMDMLPGRDLFDIIRDDRDKIEPLSTAERLHLTKLIVITVYEQTAKIHIVHRDIKPENLLVFRKLGQPLKVLVCDFGFATKEGTKPILDGAHTPNYAAPEQFSRLRADQITPKIDIFGLGITLAMLWGCDLHDNPLYPSTSDKMTDARYKSLLQDYFSLWPKRALPTSLNTLITQLIIGMLKINPEHRLSFADAIEQVQALPEDPSHPAESKSTVPPVQPYRVRPSPAYKIAYFFTGPPAMECQAIKVRYLAYKDTIMKGTTRNSYAFYGDCPADVVKLKEQKEQAEAYLLSYFAFREDVEHHKSTGSVDSIEGLIKTFTEITSLNFLENLKDLLNVKADIACEDPKKHSIIAAALELQAVLIASAKDQAEDRVEDQAEASLDLSF